MEEKFKLYLKVQEQPVPFNTRGMQNISQVEFIL